VLKVDADYRNCSRHQANLTRDRFQERRFSRSIGAEKTKNIAKTQRDTDIGDDPAPTISGAHAANR